jgi:Fanconi anemia group M protein
MDALQHITPRAYQLKIVQTCLEKNTLVILPTGIGKTLIALLLAAQRLQIYPESKILFLAPTRPLVEQHFNYFKKHLPELFAQLTAFTGRTPAYERKEQWNHSEIIFSTPQCIANDIRNKLYNLSEVSLLIEDEAHRCLRNYDYNFIAAEYKKQAVNQRIIGLTASPGSEKEKINQICKNLSIESIELRTRESEDVKPYLQKLNISVEKIDFPEEFEALRQPLKKQYQKYIDELKNRSLLFLPPTKTNIIKLQSRLVASLKRGNTNGNYLRGISICALAIKLQHALELVETQTLESFYNYLKELYQQAEKNKSKGVKQLVKSPEFAGVYQKAQEFLAKNQEHPKIEHLKNKMQEIMKNNPKAKILIFTQYRSTASYLVNQLTNIKQIHAKLFIGQAKKKGIGLSQKEQKDIIEKFSHGEINLLCATSIGEEGLDIPEVHYVIFYEPIPSEIRKIQRAGRTARLIPGNLTILVTKKTRDEAYHWAAHHKEKRMHNAIKDFQERFNENNQKNQENNQKSLYEFNAGKDHEA